MPRRNWRTRAAIVRRIDGYFSKYVRQRNADRRGMVECWTCNKRGHWRNMDCGHFQSRQYFGGRWWLLNCAVQCKRCNAQSGEQYIFARRLDEVHGRGTARMVEQRARDGHTPPLSRLIHLEKYWRERLRQLEHNQHNQRTTHATNTKAGNKLETKAKANRPRPR